MAATITVVEATGVGPSYTTITNRVRLFTSDLTTDQGTPQITYPVPIPSSDYNYSYWKHVCIQVAGIFTKVDNVRHYCDGGIGWNYGTGGELRRGNRDSGDKGCPTGDYDQATGTESTTGHTIEDGANGHTYYKGQTAPTADVESDTSGSPATIDSTGLTSLFLYN